MGYKVSTYLSSWLKGELVKTFFLTWPRCLCLASAPDGSVISSVPLLATHVRHVTQITPAKPHPLTVLCEPGTRADRLGMQEE
jgi:hypothetical protein